MSSHLWPINSTTITGILYAADAASRLSLNPYVRDGDVCIQLDSHTMWVWNGTTSAWVQVYTSTLALGDLVGTANRLGVTGGTGAIVGTGVTLNIDTSLLPSPAGGDTGKVLAATGANTAAWTALTSLDKLVRISSADTTSGYLNSKLTVGTNLNKAIVNPAGNEELNLTLTSGNLSESTSSVLTIGSGTGAVLGAGTTIEVKQSSSAQSGYLSSTDWTTFNNKQNALSPGSISEVTSSVLTVTNGSSSTVGPNVTIQVKQAGAGQAGYLSSTDWNTFNNKEPALSKGNLTEVTSSVLTISNGTNAVIGAGTSIQVKLAGSGQSGYLSNTDWTTFNGKLTSPMTTLGDIIYENVTPAAARLGGNTTTTKKFLRSVGDGVNPAAPSWEQVDYTDLSSVPSTFTPSAHNLLSASHGDTLTATVTQGDVIVGNATPKWSQLVGNTTTTKKYLQSVGVGGVAQAPSWQQTDFADLSGTTNVLSKSTLVKNTLYIPAAAIRQSISWSGASPLNYVSTGANKSSISSIDFDPASGEIAEFWFMMPKGWDRSTITAQFYWTQTSGSGDVLWRLAAAAVSDGEDLAVTYGTGQTALDTAGSNYYLQISPETSAITVGGSPATSDLLIFKIERVAADGTDTLTTDAKLVGLAIFYNTALDDT